MTPTYQPYQPPKKRRSGLLLLVLVIVAIVAVVAVMRIREAHALKRETEEAAKFTVVTINAKAGPATEEVVLPGNVTAWHDAPIYARTSGYIKRWVTNIGAKVKAGDVLAEIDTREVDAQLRQAEADVATAQANEALAATTAKRWVALRKSDSVSKQEADEKIGDAAAKKAALASAMATRDRLKELEGFKHVVAPFNGVITARNIDNGALVNAGNGGAATELFHIAQSDRLRIYVQIPENYTQQLNRHLAAELHFSEHPGKLYNATLNSTADALDPVTRTLMAEFAADNKSGELLAGGFTEAHLKLAGSGGSVRLPANTLLFRAQGLSVASVGADGKVTLKQITLGRDFGTEVEVLHGVDEGEQIIINPPDSLVDGDTVTIAKPKEAAAKEGEKKDADQKSDAKKDEAPVAKDSVGKPETGAASAPATTAK